MVADTGRVASLAPPVVTAAALLVHVLAALRLDGRPPTDGEARLAAAVFAARDARIGAVSLPLPDLLAARQLAAVTVLVPVGATSVWDAVRVAGLVLGAVTAVLTWAVLRRLGCGGLSVALAVAVVGVTPAALVLHASATPAAVAVPWLLLAALLAWRGRVLGILAGVAALIAVLTAPVAGAVLLALAAHWVADRTVSRTSSPRRGVPLAALLGGAAVGVAVASAGRGPLAGAGPMIVTPPVLAGVVCGLVVVGLGWRVRWARPLVTPAVLLLAVLLVPGPGRAGAALVALALLAVVTAAVADDLAARVAATTLSGAWPAVAAAVVVLAVVSIPSGRPTAEPAPASLLAWAGEQQSSGAMLHADPLDRAELVAAGFPPERLRGLGGPVADVDVLLLADRPHTGALADPPAHCAAGTLLATLPRWGGAPAEICGARGAATTDDPAERASRVRFGTSLAGNSGLQLAPAAAELLRRGAVDPRVMIVLVALTSGHTLAVADFPAAALEPEGTLRHQVAVTTVDGAPAAGAASVLRGWLDGQHPPYVPSTVRGDAAGLLVGYRDAAPSGLLPRE
jgi:hypothetical protein